MGREIRMVPPNWEHPKNDHGKIQPMHDEDYETAARKWKDGYALWEKGEHPSQKKYEYWEYAGTPDPEICRPKFTEDPTWFQMYETVSEGTPVSPPFETKAELVDYLVENGDFWDQKRGDGGWKRENAESFVESGFAFTGLIKISKEGGCEIKMARDGQSEQ